MRTIFVSSTFVDMQQERDAMRDTVAAKINSIANEYNDHIEFCDLRWGINTEDMESEEASRKVLDVCLDEIDRSNPPMIILLGYRYGWIPDEKSVVSIADRKKIILDDLRKSVTALEAEYGVSRFHNALIYLREIVNVTSDTQKYYLAEDEEHKTLLDSLKNYLSGLLFCKVKTYSVHVENNKIISNDIDSFAEMVVADLKNELQPYWDKFALMTEFERERERQWTFIREKNNVFRARTADAEALMAAINGENQIVVCKGVSGSGKSTLCSNIAIEAKDAGWNVVPFIGGLTDESNDAMDILRNTVYYIEEQLSLEHFTISDGVEIKETTVLLTEFQKRLVKVAEKFEKTGKKILVVVDALDQLFPDEVRDKCGFIPEGISKCIKFFITSLPDIELPEKDYYVLNPLTNEDREKVVKGVLDRVGKELAPRVSGHLLEMKAADNPYYISMVAQRLCMMEGLDFEVANASKSEPIIALGDRQIEILNSCPDDLEEMSVCIFSEAAKRIDENMLSLVVNYLAVSRYGLRRSDLAALTGSEWNELNFSHFLNYLYEDFQIRTDGRIDFMHKTIRKGVCGRLKEHISYNQGIVDYLKTLDKYDSVRMDEILYHAIKADDFDTFKEYIRQYETGENADEIIIKRAAVSVKSACLEDKGIWLENLLNESVNQNNSLELLLFVIFELSDVLGNNYQEKEIKKRLLLAAKNFLKIFEEKGIINENLKNELISKLSKELMYISDIISDSNLKIWAGERRLEWAKKKYNTQDAYHKYKLFCEYYNVLFALKSASDEVVLRKGIQIAEEGLLYLDDDVKNNISGNEMAYFGCFGEIYGHLKEYKNQLKIYRRDLELREHFFRNNPTDYNKLLVGAANSNVAHACIVVASIESQSYFRYAYRYSRDCISIIEQLDKTFLKKSGFNGYLIGNMYYEYGQIAMYSNNEYDEKIDLKTVAFRSFVKACEWIRYDLKMDISPSLLFDLNLFYEALIKNQVPENMHEEIIEKFRLWLGEDENNIVLNSEPIYYYLLSLTCLVSAWTIYNSSMTSFYDFGLEYCNKGIEMLETKLQFFEEKKVRTLMSNLYYCKYSLLSVMNPDNKDEPLLQVIYNEEQLSERYNMPSIKLGEYYYSLAISYYSQKRINDAILTMNKAVDVCMKISKSSDEGIKNNSYVKLKTDASMKTLKWQFEIQELVDKYYDCKNKGDIEKKSGNIKNAKEYYLQALEIVRKIKEAGIPKSNDMMCSILSCLSVAEMLLGNSQKSRDYSEEALEICQEIDSDTKSLDSRVNVALLLGRIGEAELQLGNKKRAKEYLIKSLYMRKGINDENSTLSSREDLAIAYTSLSDLEETNDNFEESEDLLAHAIVLREGIKKELKSIQSFKKLSASYNKIIELEKNLDNKAKAKEYCEKKLGVDREIYKELMDQKSLYDLGFTTDKMAFLELSLGNNEKAEGYFKEELAIVKKMYNITKDPEWGKHIIWLRENIAKCKGLELILYQNDEFYEGQVKEGKPSGQGTMFYANGKIKHIGEWKNGKPNGRGKEITDEFIYEGTYLDGIRDGLFTITDIKNSSQYEKKIKNGKESLFKKNVRKIDIQDEDNNDNYSSEILEKRDNKVTAASDTEQDTNIDVDEFVNSLLEGEKKGDIKKVQDRS